MAQICSHENPRAKKIMLTFKTKVDSLVYKATTRNGISHIIGALIGGLIVLLPSHLLNLRSHGLEPLGALLGIILIVFSLFGELPVWISWTQRVGMWLVFGIAIGTVILLIPTLRSPLDGRSSFYAFSPTVWAAYLSIVAVSISFEQSSLPQRVYRFCHNQSYAPATLAFFYVIIAGLLGNVFDGVTIIAISVVIFLTLLPRVAAIESSFALLFGGLISNLITVAAEPTNIKFQDALGPVLDRIRPSYWLTNWPISIFGILLPALWLWWRLHSQNISWKKSDDEEFLRESGEVRNEGSISQVLSILAVILLGLGIIAHSIAEVQRLHQPGSFEPYPLWEFLLPAGIFALVHLYSIQRFNTGISYVRQEFPVWGRLMLIFSLIWYLSNGLTSSSNVFSVFFTWSSLLRYNMQVILSLLSSITDNVAIAGMQGAIIINHPLPIWQIRLLFLLLTWSGGFTYFGCLQSLALNSRLHLTTPEWFKAALPWAILSIIGGGVGLAMTVLIYR